MKDKYVVQFFAVSKETICYPLFFFLSVNSYPRDLVNVLAVSGLAVAPASDIMCFAVNF